MINKIFVTILLSVLLVSCKAKQKMIAPAEVATAAVNETAKNIIVNHNAVNRDFKTAYIKSNVDYHDAKQSLSVSADIRIKKDEIILVTVKMFGFTGAKALITPTEVKYYEKVGGKYFEGDYKMLSDWLGTDLDFQKVQNLLLGKAMDDLTLGKYNVAIEENNPKLEEITDGNFAKSYIFDPKDFWLNRQEIKQLEPERRMIANYSRYKSYQECVFPMELAIFAVQGDKITTIAIENKNVSFNEELTFPYSVPSGYEQIKINK
ncbi:DUF4292 domain-containing protein [Flavobacterium sp. H122]|uniref:DUF4292 domain-containing protein n=1 Tax=Flavobacterium sp. H122 TaxID=2529860 RepID=UPI0010A9AB1C|nr:DUF4292 domain-containing protein [Flavobacterium sp. H122]